MSREEIFLTNRPSLRSPNQTTPARQINEERVDILTYKLNMCKNSSKINRDFSCLPAKSKQYTIDLLNESILVEGFAYSIKDDVDDNENMCKK